MACRLQHCLTLKWNDQLRKFHISLFLFVGMQLGVALEILCIDFGGSSGRTILFQSGWSLPQVWMSIAGEYNSIWLLLLLLVRKKIIYFHFGDFSNDSFYICFVVSLWGEILCRGVWFSDKISWVGPNPFSRRNWLSGMFWMTSWIVRVGIQVKMGSAGCANTMVLMCLLFSLRHTSRNISIALLTGRTWIE